MLKKGDAAIVATVLLIMAAVVAGLLVSSFSQKSTTKVAEKITDLGTSVECNDVRLSLSYSGGDLIITNRGTLGIDQIKLRIYSGESITTEDIETFDGEEKLMPQVTYIHEDITGFNRIEAKPILIMEEGDLIGCNEVSYEPEE